MRIDLEQALTDIAASVHDDATAGRMTGQVRTMVGRVRRRRAARHTAQGAVGVGAAAAVALVGVNLDSIGGRGAETPWGSGSPDPGRGEVDLRFPECGAVAPGLTDSVADAPTQTTFGDLDVRFETDEAVLRGFSEPGEDPATAAVVIRGVPVSNGRILSDGVVVSTRTLWGPVPASEPPGPTPLAVKAIDCLTGEPLPAGEYELAVTTDLGDEGTEITRIPFTIPPTTEAERLARADAEAERDRLARESERIEAETQRAAERLQEAKTEVARHLGAAHDGFPACASRLPVVEDAPLVLELGDLGSPEDWTGPAPSSPETVLRTTGGRRVLANASTGAAGLLVLREGVVVGGRVPDGDDVDLVDLGPTDSLRLPTTPSLDVCGATTADGDAMRLPPGTYQVVATLEVVLKEVAVVADGDAVSVTEPLVVTSAPREITIG